MESSNKNDDVERALSRYQSVDSLILRPKLDSIDAALDQGGHAEKQRITLLAHQELEQLIRNSPADPNPYLRLAEIYQRQHRWKDTLRVLDTGIQHNPDFEPLIVLREDLVLEAAEHALEEAIVSNSNAPDRETQLHLERSRTNLANEKLHYCTSRLKRHPNQVELLIIWAEALKELQRTEEALPLLERAAMHAPQRARALLEMGICQQKLNRPLDALSSFRRAALFRVPPPDPRLRFEALTLAFELSDRLGMVDAAIRYAEMLVKDGVPSPARILKRIAVLKQTPH